MIQTRNIYFIVMMIKLIIIMDVLAFFIITSKENQ